MGKGSGRTHRDPERPAPEADPRTAATDWRDLVRSMKQARKSARRARRDARLAMPWWRRLIPTWRMVLGTVITVVLLCAGAFVALYLLVQVPDPNAAAVAQSNVYLYADGTELGRTGAINRESVPITGISLAMQHAVVSAEDRTFYSNSGVDIRGILRAAWNTVTGRGVQGGSTITQQYVKAYYLNQDQTVARKAKEVIIALKTDETDSKSTIMAGYLNTSYFGRNAYGIKAAAQAYYGVAPDRLDVAQSAYLAALLKAPSAYDVATATPASRAAALARWNYVLDGMVKLGYLDAAERARISFPTPREPTPTPGVSGQAGYLIDIARRYLVDHGVVDDATLESGGWQITTTFDREDQNALAAAVRRELRRLPRTADAKAIRVGAASLDPASGRLVAAYGGPDYAVQAFNDATRTDLQVGSTFKAFDLAAGLQNQTVTPDSRYDGNSRHCVQGLPRGQHYCPPNEDDRDYGRVTLREAMAKSINAVFAQEAADAGLGNVRRAAVAAGLPADTPDMIVAPALALGVATPSPLDMAGAYGTFDNHGQHVATWSVQALARYGKSVRLPGHPSAPAFSRTTADQVTSVLRGVVGADGTGYLAGSLHRPAAGKTGTTDDNHSAWFVGYTPELTTSVAMFAEEPGNHRRLSLGTAAGIARVNGGSYPTQIWTSYMAAALADRPVQDFQLTMPKAHAPRGRPTPSRTQPHAPAPPRSPAPTRSATPTTSTPPAHRPKPAPSPTPSRTVAPTTSAHGPTPSRTIAPTRSAISPRPSSSSAAPAPVPTASVPVRSPNSPAPSG